MLLLQLLINGIQVGALYGLTAVGFSLIFGSTKIFHFAHGSAFAIAAYVFYYLYSVTAAHWLVAAMAAAVAAVLFGLRPRQLSTYAFALGSLLVVPAAILTAAGSGINPAIGHHVMLISLAATIVGGVGSLRGAACAGLLLGLAENLALWVFEPQWSEAVTFIVLFLFILFRPSGFFGRAVTS